MRILIDECLNWRLARALTGHHSVSVQKMGWGGLDNGTLLTLAEREFDVFLTGDRNLSFQQSVIQYQIAVLVLHAPGTQLHQTLPLISKVLVALPSLKPGQVLEIYP
jgi:predicted nuclease of predicted toxin-antitoxin system